MGVEESDERMQEPEEQKVADDSNGIEGVDKEFGNKSAHEDQYALDTGLTLIAILGIRDELRESIKEAV